MKVLRLKVNQYSCGNEKRTAASIIQSKNKLRFSKILFARFDKHKYDSGIPKFEKSVVVLKYLYYEL